MPWSEKSYGRANMVIRINTLQGWINVPTCWPSGKEWDFVVKNMEAAVLAQPNAPMTKTIADGSEKLDLQRYIQTITSVPGLEPFTLTKEAKVQIDEAKDWGPQSYAHLEGDGRIMGRVLDKIPDDEELFEHWEEFNAAYAHTCIQHRQRQETIAANAAFLIETAEENQ